MNVLPIHATNIILVFIQVDEDLHEDLSSVMEDNNQMITDKYPPDSFPAIFWSQQRQAASLKNAKSMKWEAAMIRSVFHCKLCCYLLLCAIEG